jgi:hypothetical protein
VRPSSRLRSGDNGKTVDLDVDLPEIEDLPRRVTSVPERGYKLTLKELKGKALQELYSRHVHGIGFRIIGEVFATLPTVEQVTLSAFTQRDAPATGQRSDTYVYSVRVLGANGQRSTSRTLLPWISLRLSSDSRCGAKLEGTACLSRSFRSAQRDADTEPVIPANVLQGKGKKG